MSESNDTIAPGTVLADRYEIDVPIGHGGFGTVYRARQLNIDRDIAVKVLPQKFLTSTEVVERFRREAQLASRLRHPHTITIHDYGRHEDYLFIAMELLEGEDLADVLHRERTLSVAKIVHIATQALKSLSEAHDHGIVHRDLKPENIFLATLGNERDFIKVLDFGIAKFAMPPVPEHTESPDNPFRKDRQLTMSGSTVGTPIYMSPEQAAGEEVDGLTDIYSLGVIMYEMASGRPPFYGDNPVKIMRSHLFEQVPQFKSPALRNSPIERIILRALDKDKDKRFQNAGEFLAALALEIDLSPAFETHGYSVAPDENDEPPTLEMFAGSDESEPFFTKTSGAHAISLEFTPPAHDLLRTTEPDLVFNELESVPFIQALDTAREFVRQPVRVADNASSILTVLDDPMSDTGEILLLTRPKSIPNKAINTPTSLLTHASNPPNDAITGNFQRLHQTTSSVTNPVAPSTQPISAKYPQVSTDSPQDWNWHDLPAAPAPEQSSSAHKSQRKLPLIIGALVLFMITVVLLGLYAI